MNALRAISRSTIRPTTGGSRSSSSVSIPEILDIRTGWTGSTNGISVVCIQGLRVLQRIRAYEIIGRLAGLGAEDMTPPGLYVVLSFASSFYEFLQARDEDGRVKEKLTYRQEHDRKKFVATALGALREGRMS